MLTTYAGWRIVLNWAFVIVVVGYVAYMGHSVYSRLGAKDARVGAPIPYTVMLRETVHGPDGIARVAADATEAIRSDGSYVNRLSHANIADGTERTIFFANGLRTVVNELKDTKSTTVTKDANPARWQRDPSSKCINSFAGEPMASTREVISGEEIVAGYRTVKITFDKVSWL